MHCIGIGGIGVSALAEILLRLGFNVSGSDALDGKNTARLRKLGIKIYIGHHEANVGNVDCVIFSSAVSPDNPEYKAAKFLGIKLVQRGKALSVILNKQKCIAISGTHGKTTSTSMLAKILKTSNVGASYVIGGILNGEDSPVHIDDAGNYFVAEVDESDKSFLYVKPWCALVTNIDRDHMETYLGDFNSLKDSFLKHLESVSDDGAIFVCCEDTNLMELADKLIKKHKVFTYGFSNCADFSGYEYKQEGLCGYFKVKSIYLQKEINVKVNLPGMYNALNALGALSVASWMGISIDTILDCLGNFDGVLRRLQIIGNAKVSNGHALIIEDYGHHPRAISNVLNACTKGFDGRRIVLVLQPHRYSRVLDLYEDFVCAVRNVDKLYVLDVYSAWEKCGANFSMEKFLKDIGKLRSEEYPEYVDDINKLPEFLYNNLKDNDVVILQGAGNVGSFANKVIDLYKE